MMRQSFLASWETAATLLLLYTSYHVIVITSSSRCPTTSIGGVLGQSLSHHSSSNHPRDTEKEDLSWKEPTQRPKSTIQTVVSSYVDEHVNDDDFDTSIDDEDIIHLDHYDDDTSSIAPNLKPEKENILPIIESNVPPPNNKPTTTTTTTNTTTNSSNHNNHKHNDTTSVVDDEVIVICLVDGTLVGLSRTTGNTIWKQPPQNVPPTSLTSFPQPPPQSQEQPPHPLVKPLVSTTTTTIGRSSNSNQQQQQQSPPQRFPNTLAVPSILDGKVYLTSTSEDCSLVQQQQQNHIHLSDDDDDDDDDDTYYDPSQTKNTGVLQCDFVEDTVTTTIHNLMLRTPFVDMKNHGRIYTSQRHSVAVAIHATTGQPIRTITTSTTSSSSSQTNEPPSMAIRQTEDTTKTNTDESEAQNENGNDDILWLGRTDYTISVHEPITGELDVQFTMAEMMSIHDMLFLEEEHQQQHPHPPNQQEQQQILQQYLLPHRSDRKSHRSSYNNNKNTDHSIGDDSPTHRAISSSTRTESTMYGMIATPNGHVAYRNLYSGHIVWVATETFLHTPAVYAFDATSGRSLRVDIVPDVISPHGTMEYVLNELQEQLYEHNHHFDTTDRLDRPYDTVMMMNEPVFGALPGTGQIYAIPLLQKGVTTTTTTNTNVPPLSDATSVTTTIPDAARAYVSGTLGYHNHNNNNNNNDQYYQEQPMQQHQQLLYCHPNSPHYPRCLNSGNSIHGGGSSVGGGPDRYNPYGYNHNNNHYHYNNRQFRNNKFPHTLSDVSSFQYPKHQHGYDDTGSEDGVVGNSAIVPFYHPDYGYQYIPPNHFYTINTEWNEQYRRRKRYKKYMRIVTSWIVPTVVAALFVTVRNSLNRNSGHMIVLHKKN